MKLSKTARRIIVLILLFIIVIWVVQIQINKPERNPFLVTQLQEFENNIAFRDIQNPEVSAVPVSWHLDHSLKVINSIFDKLAQSVPAEYQSEFSFQRVYVFTMDKMPRGVGKAPSSVQPPDTISNEAIYEQLAEAKRKLVSLDSLPENSFMDHPVFGNLNREQAKKFIRIHTEHHLSIMKDIIGE
ncbi:MAG: DUF1569 domain-containing protein [Bacteroidota bacterium]